MVVDAGVFWFKEFMKKPFSCSWVTVFKFMSGSAVIVIFFVLALFIYFTIFPPQSDSEVPSFESLAALSCGVATVAIFFHLTMEHLRSRTKEHFFKFFETHQSNVKSCNAERVSKGEPNKTGRHAFAEFKYQLHCARKAIQIDEQVPLLSSEQMAKVSFECLYEGCVKDWVYNKTTEHIKSRYIKRYNKLLVSASGGKNTISNSESNEKSEDLINCLLNSSNTFHTHRTDLSVYFQNLYQMIKFIDESPLGKNEKQKSIDILKAQLSDSELYVLLYFLHSDFTVAEPMSTYAETYVLFENVPKIDQIEPDYSYFDLDESEESDKEIIKSEWWQRKETLSRLDQPIDMELKFGLRFIRLLRF